MSRPQTLQLNNPSFFVFLLLSVFGGVRRTTERRKLLSKKIVTTYASRCPVIVEPASARAPAISKNKFLSPTDMTVGAFIAELKRHLVRPEGDNNKAEAANQAIFVFTASTHLPISSWTMSQLYDKHKNADGFLYLFYDSENTFGNH